MAEGRYSVAGDQLLRVYNKEDELHRQLRAGNVDPELVNDVYQWLIERGFNRPRERDGNGYEVDKGMEQITIDLILAKERNYHLRSFGQIFDLSSFRGVLQRCGLRLIELFKDFGLEFHWLPAVDLGPKSSWPGLYKPSEKFFEILKPSNHQRSGEPQDPNYLSVPNSAGGHTVIIDVNSNSHWDGFRHDKFLRGLLDNLKKTNADVFKDLDGYYAYGDGLKRSGGDLCPRCGFSADNWHQVLWGYLSDWLARMFRGIHLKYWISLERAIQYVAIPQIYWDTLRHNDLTTTYKVWLLERPHNIQESGPQQLVSAPDEEGFMRMIQPLSIYDRDFCLALRPIIVFEN